MKQFTRIFVALAMVAMAATFTACVMGDDDEGNNGDGGGGGRQPAQITFDKTSYYPFDVASIALPEAAAAEQYTGTIGTQEVTAVRVEGSQLAIALPALPALPAGEYTLSLQTGDNRKAEGRLKIVALPELATPETVIGDIRGTFAEVLSEAQQDDDPDAAFVAELAEAFDEQLAALSPAERRQFAALWQVRYESLYTPEAGADTRGWMSDRGNALARLNAQYAGNVAKLSYAVGVFAMSATVAKTATATGIGAKAGVVAGLIAGGSAIYIVKLVKENNRMMAGIMNSIFTPVEEQLATVTRAAVYDYTLQNGATQAFSPQITLRSIYAADVGNPAAPAPAREFIGTTDLFIATWDKMAAAVNRLRQLFGIGSPMTGRPQSVSAVRAPQTEKVTPDEWTLQILSGNVQAQKSGNNAYTFTTAADQDTEFTFRITADGIESRVFSGLLQEKPEPGQSPLIGSWRGAISYLYVPYNGRTYESEIWHEESGEYNIQIFKSHPEEFAPFVDYYEETPLYDTDPDWTGTYTMLNRNKFVVIRRSKEPQTVYLEELKKEVTGIVTMSTTWNRVGK